jgi:hypothetical protein
LSLCLDHPLFSTLASPSPAPKGKKKRNRKKVQSRLAKTWPHSVGIYLVFCPQDTANSNSPTNPPTKNEKERKKERKEKKGKGGENRRE